MATNTLRGLNTRASRTAALTLAVSAIFTPSMSFAADYFTRTSAPDRNWLTNTDWSVDTIPTATDNAFIGDATGGTPSVAFVSGTGAVATNVLLGNAGTGTLNIIVE